MTAAARPAQPAVGFGGFLGILDAVRTVAFIGGCATLFWQYDAAPVDWLFGIGIAASAIMWLRGRPAFDLSWPQPLLAAFLAVTAITTAVAGGSRLTLATTVYLGLASLAFASVLRGHDQRRRRAELAIVVAGAIAVVTVALGVVAHAFSVSALDFLNHDYLRTRGLFKDPNVTGGFLAAVYPLAASWSIRRPSRRFELLALVTAAFGFGVIFSFSRLALFMFGVGYVGVAAALWFTRDRRLFTLLLGATATAAVAVVVVLGVDRLPLYRYQPIQNYDENGRFVAWAFGLEMFAQAPLGTGAGSFEPRAVDLFKASGATLDSGAPVAASVPSPTSVAQLPGFHSRWVSQSAQPRLRPGEGTAVTVTLKNTGSKAWTKGTPDQAALDLSAGALTIGDPARPVATVDGLVDQSRNPIAVGWPSPTRVAVQSEAVVAPGELGRFLFRLRAPQTGGTYVLRMHPVVDSVGGLEDEGIFVQISVAGTPVVGPAVPAGAADAPSVAAAPAAYTVPAGASRVTDSAGLVAALASGAAHDVVLANGIYDNAGPFSDTAGDRLYAATPGGAVFRAGIAIGSNVGAGGALLQGLAFDVTDPAKTLQDSVVHVWGSAAGTRILDTTFNGNHTVPSAIVARQVEGLVVQRVRVRDFTDFGILVDANTPGLVPASAPLVQDVDVSGIGLGPQAAAVGRGEACVRVGDTATVRAAELRSCGLAGIWTLGASVGSAFDRIDVDDARFGLFLDGGTAGASFRDVRLGSALLNGLYASPSAMTAAVAPATPAAAAATSAPGAIALPAVASSDTSVTPSAHNLYLRVAVETGAFGFIALMGYFAILLFGAIRRTSRLSWQWPLVIALVLIAGFGIDTLHWRDLWVYMAIVGATIVPSQAAIARQRAARRTTPGGARAVVELTPAEAVAGAAPAVTVPAVTDPRIERARAVLENRVAALGSAHPDVAMATHELAALHHELGEHDVAAALYQEAIQIYETVSGPESSTLVAPLEDLADLRRDQGREQDADVIYSRALAIIASHHRPGGPGTSKQAAYGSNEVGGAEPAR